MEQTLFAGAADASRQFFTRLLPQDRIPAEAGTGAARPPDTVGVPLLRLVLDHLQFGAAVTDVARRLAYLNRAAAHEFALRDVLRIERDCLVVASAGESARLDRALDRAGGGQWSMLCLAAGAGSLSIAVLPLRAADGDSGPLVLLLFGIRDPGESLAIQLYAKSCALTPAETRVLHDLAAGLAPQQIAVRHHVLLSTVRSQIGSIRNKTGARGITELTRILMSLPPLMPTALSCT